MKTLFSIFTLLGISLSAVTVHLSNDTIYYLDAEIKNARGELQVKITLPPDALMDWSDTYGEQGYSGPFPPPPDQHVYSSTPFTVTWRCPEGDVYSVDTHVAPGAVVQASRGDGKLSCGKPASTTTPKAAPTQ